MVIWLIGLSGAGKTEIGKRIYREWKKRESATVLIDGDTIREIFKHNRGDNPYTVQGRKINADRICEMCLWLDKQNVNVVCCILSIFRRSRIWNRENYSKYFEVYISVPFDTLVKRDIKNLYRPALDGKTKNVVGVDIKFEIPQKPDLVFDNSKHIDDFDSAANTILETALEKVCQC